MCIEIGPLRLDNAVFLAPMSGVTDAPFRRLARRMGAGLVVSEMIVSRGVIQRTRESERRRQPDGAEGPLVIQLAGAEPELMAEAARLSEGLGAAMIDINMGCPVKKVAKGKQAGAALMRDEDLAARLIEATVAAVSVPVGLKMRTGWDASRRNAPRLARIAERGGISLITVHGRTREQGFAGKADWDFIARVKAGVGVPVIANGDVESFDDAAEILCRSGADGVMVGRGACGRPWFPGAVARFLETGQRPAAPTLLPRLRVLGVYPSRTGGARSRPSPHRAPFPATSMRYPCPRLRAPSRKRWQPSLDRGWRAAQRMCS